LQVWPQLVIGTVIKRSLKRAAVLLRRSAGGTMLNTAFIERFNGTMRERLASLTRTCRHAARRLEALHSGMYPASHHL
jgi:IS1 family transposase